MTPRPQTVSVGLIGQINSMVAQGHALPKDSIDYRRLEKEADSLLKVDAQHGYMVRGALKSLTFDIDAVHEDFERATRLGFNEVVLRNYAVCLENLGYFSESLPIAAQVQQRYSSELGGDIRIALEAGQFRLADQLITYWHEQHPAQTLPDVDEAVVREAADVLHTQGVTDVRVAAVLDVAGSVLRQHKLFSHALPDIIIYETGGEKCVLFQFKLRVEPMVAAAIEFEIVESSLAADAEFSNSPLRLAVIGGTTGESQLAA